MITYGRAMRSPDKEMGRISKEEYKKMVKYRVFKPIAMQDVEWNARVLSSKWAIEEKGKWHLQGLNHSKRMQLSGWRAF